MEYLKKISLRHKLIGLVLLSLLPVLLILMSVRQSEHGQAREVLRTHVQRLSVFAAREERQMLEATEHILHVMAQAYALFDDPEDRDRLLRLVLAEHPRFSGLAVSSLEGTLLAAGSEGMREIDLPAQEWFQTAVESMDLAVGTFQIGPDNEPILGMALPYKHPENGVEYVVVGTMKLSWLNRFEQGVSAQLPEASTICKVDKHGTVLAQAPEGDMVGRAIDQEGLDVLEGAGARELGSRSLGGKTMFVTVAPLDTVLKGVDIRLLLMVPLNTLFAESDRLFLRNLLLLGVVALVSLAASLMAGDRLFVRRIAALAQGADRINRGEFNARTGMAHQGDEINGLAASFDAMAAALEDRERQRDEAEAELRRSEAESRAKSAFLAQVSHEVRTPISGILGISELALQRELPAEVESDLHLIHDSADSALNLLNDMLDLSRITTGKLELRENDFNLRRSVEQLSILFDLLARDKSLTLDLHIDPHVPEWVHGDQHRLHQVLRNLLVNAVKFTPRGAIRLQVMNGEKTEERVRLSFAVSDTGIGIPQDRLVDIFDPFAQVDGANHAGGIGLGLAVSKRLVEMMGGEIQVRSTPGSGSTFEFSVYVDHPRQTPVPSENAPNLEEIAPKTILLAEDNQINRVFLQRALSQAGHRVLVAEDGQQVLELLERERVDCILMDVHMPVLDGLKATERIRSGASGINDPHLPIIALTACAMSGDREKFLAEGMDDYVPKPVDLGELALALRNLAKSR